MIVENTLAEKSLGYTEEHLDLRYCTDELESLFEIFGYCNTIGEKIRYRAKEFYDTEIAEGVTLTEWLFMSGEEVDETLRRSFIEYLDQFTEEDSGGEEEIRIGINHYLGCTSNEREYVDARRTILIQIGNVQEFADFMGSCFLQCKFAENIGHGMREIQHFSKWKSDIVHDLSILNDDGPGIYHQFQHDPKRIIDEIKAKVKGCSGDPGNKDKLNFCFEYESMANGKKEKESICVTCHIHTKIEHLGSNMRIYFSLEPVEGHGENVLIGHIGAHPY